MNIFQLVGFLFKLWAAQILLWAGACVVVYGFLFLGLVLLCLFGSCGPHQ